MSSWPGCSWGTLGVATAGPGEGGASGGGAGALGGSVGGGGAGARSSGGGLPHTDSSAGSPGFGGSGSSISNPDIVRQSLEQLSPLHEVDQEVAEFRAQILAIGGQLDGGAQVTELVAHVVAHAFEHIAVDGLLRRQ